MKTPLEETLHEFARAMGQCLEELPPKVVTDRDWEVLKNACAFLCPKCSGFGYYTAGMSTDGCTDCDGVGLSKNFRAKLEARIQEQVAVAYIKGAATFGPVPIDFVHVDNVANERERRAPAFRGIASNPTPRAFPAHEPEPPEPKGTPDADGT